MAIVLSAVAVVTSKWAVAPLSAAVALSTVAASPHGSWILALKETFLAFYWLAHRGLRIVLHVQLGGDLLARLERCLIVAMTQVHLYT